MLSYGLVFREVRAFYASVVRKMVAKFPFDSVVLKDLVVMDLSKRDDLTYAPSKHSPVNEWGDCLMSAISSLVTFRFKAAAVQGGCLFAVVRLATQFAPDVDEEALKDEYEDLQLVEDDQIRLQEGGHHRRLDVVWGEVLAMRTPLGARRFPTLARVMAALLALPHSNADCERAFSMVRKVHTECRKSLGADTVTAYLQCKLNFDTDCCDFVVTPAMLREAKRATISYNEEHA